MAKVERAAAALNLLNALWACGLSWNPSFGIYHCPANGCPAALFIFPPVLLALGIVLVIDSVICFIGLRLGFLAGAVLSMAIAGMVVLQWRTFYPFGGDFGSVFALLLSAGALILDLVSMRSRMIIPEESHPLNLPVFG